MSRLAPLDKTLVLVLVPLWAVCFLLAVKTQFEGGGYAAVGLSISDAASYPVLIGEFAGEYASNPLEEASLQAGDLLVRAGGVDLRGVDTLAFQVIVKQEAKQSLSIPLVYERENARFETALGLIPVSVWRPLLAMSFSLAMSALYLILRARPTHSVRAYFLAAFCPAIAYSFFHGGGLIYAWVSITVIANGLLLPLLLRFAQTFPDDIAPEGYWHRVWPWLFAALGPFHFLYDVAGRFAIGLAGIAGTSSLAMAAVLVVTTGKYRRVGPVARRQMKWALLGAYCAALPMVIVFALAFFEPRFGFLIYPSFWAAPVFPVALVVSVNRFNLFDVDRLLSTTASYNVIVVLLGAGALIVVPRIAEAVSEIAQVNTGTSQAVLFLALVAVLVPAHRRLRPQIDRLFFKERYALDRGIAELLPTLSKCTNARELTEHAGAELLRLLRPETCVVYASAEQGFAPVFVEGRAVPPAFVADSPLIGTLRARRAPLSLSDAGRRPDEALLGPFDRAALETLQAEVVVPVRQEEGLSAFLCLGPKRSGDVYTSTDLSHLVAVAETVSHQLQHFDQDLVASEARAMQESLRCYVPGVIAEQLLGGLELADGEKEVSVLFVDIRGYTNFSESRSVEEIFSTVNRFTEAVSQIVQRHAGGVVEFNGDGMMAVFGAPRELAHKERAAVEAAREMLDAVAALPIEDQADGEPNLSVGVGIATGTAFVGNIQAVDRKIWTAIGNTTNLAARLQGMSRELDAAVVIDRMTWERGEQAAAGFENRPDMTIRGRRETQDLFILPMPETCSGE